MIDLHCHLLPGVDDGSRDMETTIAMAAAYQAAGFTGVCMTPHIRPRMFDNDEAHLLEVFEQTKADLDELGFNLELRLGAEYYVESSFLDKLKHPETLLLLGESRFVLMEFNPISRPANLVDIVFHMKVAGLTPVMAHPERYAFVAEDLGFVEELVRTGMLMQGTLGPLSGMFGSKPRKTLKRLLDADLIHLISTDAHGPGHVKKDLDQALARLDGWIGKGRRLELMRNNPARIWRGEPIVL